MNKKLKVYIADDHTLFRKAMVNLLLSFESIETVKDAENGKELLTLMKYECPDVAIVDLQMPVMDGADTCEAILEKYPDVKIIILTMHDSEKYILHMMEMGVHAFLLKNTEPDELEEAIHSIVEKDFYHNDLVASVLRKNVRDKKAGQRPVFSNAELSEREKEIVVLVCQELPLARIRCEITG
jgi:two-component system, NarL family, response regulator DegU